MSETLDLEAGWLNEADRKRLEPVVKTAMESLLNDLGAHYFTDGDTRNLTKLTEMVACDLDLYGPPPECPIPEDFFEWAYEVLPEVEPDADE